MAQRQFSHRVFSFPPVSITTQTLRNHQLNTILYKKDERSKRGNLQTSKRSSGRTGQSTSTPFQFSLQDAALARPKHRTSPFRPAFTSHVRSLVIWKRRTMSINFVPSSRLDGMTSDTARHVIRSGCELRMEGTWGYVRCQVGQPVSSRASWTFFFTVSHSEGRHAPQNIHVTHKTSEDSVTVRFHFP
jgi:hypothetical protein